jgi:hypothetical protein
MGNDGAAGPLRIGLLLDGYTQPRWVLEALERVQRETSARIVAVALNVPEPSTSQAPPASRLGRWYANRRVLLQAAHRRLDQWKFPLRSSPFLPADIQPLVAGATIVPVHPRRTKFSDYFPDEAIAALRSCDLDIAIRLGFRILRGEALQIARYGVWSYHHGDKATNRGGPPAYWEVLEAEPTTGAILQVLSEQLDDGRVLAEGWVRTDRFSTGRNAAQLYWMAEPFLARAVAALEVRRATEGATPEPPPPMAPSSYSRRLYRPPSNGELYAPLTRLARRYVARHAQYSRAEEQWYLAYDTGRAIDASAGFHLAPYRFRTWEPPHGVSWADPFPVEVNGERVLFFEEFKHTDGRGRILVADLAGDGTPGTAVPALDLPYHLAYPFHFSHQGEQFLMPECGTRNAIEVWRARRFPDDWTLEHSMLAGAPWVDATLYQLDGRWVLFAGLDTSARGDWDELHIFFGDSPFGPWRPHRRNPVVVDVRSARPAGRLIRSGGRLYRPAQDGYRSYGSALRIQEITRLTETEYEERTVTQLHPEWLPRLVGTHTYNQIPGFAIIDVRRVVPRHVG